MNLFLENVRLALFSLKANKMRALLTMLGIIIGIAAVIAIMTVGNSLTIYMTSQMAANGSNNVYVFLTQKDKENEVTEEGHVFEADNTVATLTVDDMFTREMIENYYETYKDDISAISLSIPVGNGVLQDEQRTSNINAIGISLGYLIENNTKTTSGRFFTDAEVEGKKKVCIVSSNVVDNVFDGDNEKALGSTVQINIDDKYLNFTIIGTYEYEKNPYSFSQASAKNTVTEMYIPLSTGKELRHWDNYPGLNVVTKSGVDPKKFASTTKQYFASYYRNNDNYGVDSFTMASMVDMMSSMMGTLTTAISVIAGIALLVGGIGVMNIMLVSITERTREIGTRKALGAPNSSIRMQFIVEAVVICLIGGFIGVVLGIVGGSLAANLLLKTPASPSIASIFLSLGFSMLIGVFFGYYPANKAAKMDPIEALRYE